MLRMALPKGRLLNDTLNRLAKGGLEFDISGRNYSPESNWKNIRGKIVKVRAIPQLLSLGNFHIGFCGLDLFNEAASDKIVPVCDLKLNTVRLVAAVSKATPDILSHPPKRPLVIATEYEMIASRWAQEKGLAHIIVQTWGSTEGYVPEDADIAFDCVETGKTLEANGLVVIEEIMESSTWLISNINAYNTNRQEIDNLIDIITGGK